MATLRTPSDSPSPREDANTINEAFKGRGCETSKIIKILAHRDATQRGLIQQEYETKYSDDLNKRLKSELSGHVKKAVLLWMYDPVTRDAKILRKALRGPVTDHKAATEIICSRTAAQLRQIKHVYSTNYPVRLEQDIEDQASGDHKRLLLAYLTTTRYEGPEIDTMLVESDAKALHSAVNKKHGAEEKIIIQIFSDRSPAHLIAITHTYRQLFRKDLPKAIKHETSGNFEHALLTILQCTENLSFYFAKGLRKAMKGLGTDDRTLIRMIVTRVELDMQNIKAEYQKKYRKTLYDAVYSDTSGHYRTFLLSLLGHPNY